MNPTGLVPLIRYRAPEAAIAWLGKAFAFEATNVVRESDGSVAYAELSYGRGIVMIGPVGDSSLDALLRQPDEIGGLGTQACYVAVDSVTSHRERARAAGAEIVLDVGSDSAGDRAYAARDPEGHIWNFGAYSPWRGSPSSLSGTNDEMKSGTKLQSMLAAMVMVLATFTAGAVFLSKSNPADPAEAKYATRPETQTLSSDRRVSTAVEPTAATSTLVSEPEPAAIANALEREAHVRRELARTAAVLRAELDRERGLREAAEAELNSLRTRGSAKTGAGSTIGDAGAASQDAGGPIGPCDPGRAGASHPPSPQSATPAPQSVGSFDGPTGAITLPIRRRHTAPDFTAASNHGAAEAGVALPYGQTPSRERVESGPAILPSVCAQSVTERADGIGVGTAVPESSVSAIEAASPQNAKPAEAKTVGKQTTAPDNSSKPAKALRSPRKRQVKPAQAASKSPVFDNPFFLYE